MGRLGLCGAVFLAGCQLGSPLPDSGSLDAGTGTDAGPDAGGPAPDAGGMPDGGPLPDAGSADAGPRIGPVGVYVPTFHAPIASDAELTTAIGYPWVDGFFVSRPWRTVEPVEGTFDWTTLDQDLQAIVAAGKHAT